VSPAISGEYRMTAEPGTGIRRRPVTGPHRYASMEMPAVTPPPSGRMLDDALDFDFDLDADGALELDGVPSSHSTRGEASRPLRIESPPVSRRASNTHVVTRATPPRGQVAHASQTTRAASTSSSSVAVVDTHAGIVAFAGFGDPPAGLFAAPGYAMRAIKRRRVLRAQLASARYKRSHDVGLYEASLRICDEAAIRNGVIMIAAIISMSLLLAFALVRVAMGLLASGP
jgi:hypothetical protein